ncbi:LON peptidase substrate-binding domain-containing protein [Dyella sp.]|jgi:Lon protease-like protein|uniref:LON peptidase substrate-binding domain-containing protein n=1 Tax=Dyella sp. TaxID=1869338 RepID=UPI002D798C5C|nr:LON peptidase substrate-binding domain-containing protein [Dyella sp.]HET6430737.1 LON peptidase substrate-binding domain-containing protein [Dyella sp.]
MAGQTPLIELPLFPLATVLYPGAPMPLRIFEPRYIDMVRDCTRSGTGFGVCLILDGYEVGEAALPAAVGTIATITDFHTTEEGLLGIVAHGGQRFRVEHTRVRTDGLLRGMVQPWPAEPALPVPAEFGLLTTILERLVETLGPHWSDAPRNCYDDASWVGFRLAELLPLANPERQRMLELTDPLERLAELRDILPRFQKS